MVDRTFPWTEHLTLPNPRREMNQETKPDVPVKSSRSHKANIHQRSKYKNLTTPKLRHKMMTPLTAIFCLCLPKARRSSQLYKHLWFTVPDSGCPMWSSSKSRELTCPQSPLQGTTQLQIPNSSTIKSEMTTWTPHLFRDNWKAQSTTPFGGRVLWVVSRTQRHIEMYCLISEHKKAIQP